MSFAKKIRKLRVKRHHLKWREICVKLGILKVDGEPDTGLAYLIAYKGLQPRRETQVRIGLCRRKVEYGVRPPRVVAPVDAWWRSLTAEQRARVYEIWREQ
jgi:hypothetical protein